MQIKFDVYKTHCPSRNVLEVISDKWSILLINILSKKVYRFGELKQVIEGISAKMLSQTLRSLEKYGLVERKDYFVLPLKVEYSLSALGKELSLILSSITAWTEKNMEKFIEAENIFNRNKDNNRCR